MGDRVQQEVMAHTCVAHGSVPLECFCSSAPVIAHWLRSSTLNSKGHALRGTQNGHGMAHPDGFHAVSNVPGDFTDHADAQQRREGRDHQIRRWPLGQQRVQVCLLRTARR